MATPLISWAHFKRENILPQKKSFNVSFSTFTLTVNYFSYSLKFSLGFNHKGGYREILDYLWKVLLKGRIFKGQKGKPQGFP